MSVLLRSADGLRCSVTRDVGEPKAPERVVVRLEVAHSVSATQRVHHSVYALSRLAARRLARASKGSLGPMTCPSDL